MARFGLMSVVGAPIPSFFFFFGSLKKKTTYSKLDTQKVHQNYEVEKKIKTTKFDHTMFPLRALTGTLRRAASPLRSQMRYFSMTRPSFSINTESVKPMDPVKLLGRKINYTKPRDITPLKEASALYATIHIHDRKFLVTEGDKIILPVKMRDVKIGDILNFDQVSVIGSRDYTLTGGPRIDRNVFSIKGTVIEKTREKREVEGKTKRRRRHVRNIVKKNALTVIRISDLKVNLDY